MPTPRTRAHARPYAMSASDSAAPLRALGRKGGLSPVSIAPGGLGAGGGDGDCRRDYLASLAPAQRPPCPHSISTASAAASMHTKHACPPLCSASARGGCRGGAAMPDSALSSGAAAAAAVCAGGQGGHGGRGALCPHDEESRGCPGNALCLASALSLPSNMFDMLVVRSSGISC